MSSPEFFFSSLDCDIVTRPREQSIAVVTKESSQVSLRIVTCCDFNTVRSETFGSNLSRGSRARLNNITQRNSRAYYFLIGSWKKNNLFSIGHHLHGYRTPCRIRRLVSLSETSTRSSSDFRIRRHRRALNQPAVLLVRIPSNALLHGSLHTDTLSPMGVRSNPTCHVYCTTNKIKSTRARSICHVYRTTNQRGRTTPFAGLLAFSVGEPLRSLGTFVFFIVPALQHSPRSTSDSAMAVRNASEGLVS